MCLGLLVLGGASGPAYGATPGAEKFQVQVPPVTPTYGCKSSGRGTRRTSTCKTDYALSKPLKTSGDVTFEGPPRLKGDMTVTYNQYEFAGKFRFANGTLRSASGTGSAQATWAMRFADSGRSMLWGTFVSRDIRIRKAGGSRARLTLSYAVEVSGGSGRFEGLTGACPVGHCKYDVRETFIVRRPGDLPRASGSALMQALETSATQASEPPTGAGELELGLERGNPHVQLPLPLNGRILLQDPRPLQAAAPPGSTCTASAEDRRSGAVIDLGQAIADQQGTVTFPGRLMPALLGGGAFESGWRVTVSCTSPRFDLVPIAPVTQAVRSVDARPCRACHRPVPGVGRFVNRTQQLTFRRVAYDTHWLPPGSVHPGETQEAGFDTWKQRHHVIYSYQGRGFPRHSQGYLDVGDLEYSLKGSCDVRPTNGPNKASCTVSKTNVEGAIVFTVTIEEKPL